MEKLGLGGTPPHRSLQYGWTVEYGSRSRSPLEKSTIPGIKHSKNQTSKAHQHEDRLLAPQRHAWCMQFGSHGSALRGDPGGARLRVDLAKAAPTPQAAVPCRRVVLPLLSLSHSFLLFIPNMSDHGVDVDRWELS